MTVKKLTRNSKKNFLGGGMGILTPLGRRPAKPSEPPSETKEQSFQSVIPLKDREMIGMEAREQMGYQPEADESDSATGQDKKG